VVLSEARFGDKYVNEVSRFLAAGKRQ
jgi:hypothetical protein